MKKISRLGKGYRSNIIHGLGLLGAFALLIWCHYEPGLLSEGMQGMLEGIAGWSAISLGLRQISDTPSGKSGD